MSFDFLIPILAFLVATVCMCIVTVTAIAFMVRHFRQMHYHYSGMYYCDDDEGDDEEWEIPVK